jgi:hypothetical protein
LKSLSRLHVDWISVYGLGMSAYVM